MKTFVLVIVSALLAIVLVGNPSTPHVVSIAYTPAPPATPTPAQRAEATAAPTPDPIDDDRAEELVDALAPLVIKVREERKYVLAKSSIVALTEADVQGLLPFELTRAWQEIYARHGKAEDPWFETRTWFSPRSDFRERDLSRLEQSNVELLKRAAERELERFTPLSRNITKNGTVQVKIDLDGDGAPEPLTVGWDKTTGALTLLCGATPAALDGLSGDGLIYAVDWNTSDAQKELLVPLLVDRELQTIHLAWRDGAFVELGRTEGNVESLRWRGDGTLQGWKTESVPTTWSHAQTYRLAGDALAEETGTLVKMNVPVTLRATITLPGRPGGTRPVSFIAGEDATFVATDGQGWYALLAADDDSIGWFQLAQDGKTILHVGKGADAVFKWGQQR